MQNLIKRFFCDNEIPLPSSIPVKSIKTFINIYKTWNHRFHFSSFNSRVEILEKHFLDSFSLNAIISNQKIADIGSGAGFPGLAYTLINAGCGLVSIERNRRKLNFQRVIAAELSLKGVTFIESSLERVLDLPDVDYYVFRAVENRDRVFRWLDENLKGAKAIYMAAGQVPPELLRPPFQPVSTFSYVLPLSGAKRTLVVFRRGPG